MQKKSNFDKTLLVIMALLALGVSGYLGYLTQGFADTLVQKKVAPRNETEAVPLAQVQEATDLLKKVFNWQSPQVNNKPVPLNKSILVILKNDALFDLYVAEPTFRPPLTNEFLLKSNIPNSSLFFPNVGDLDPDGDGYSNIEEFTAHTDPMDPLKHPPFTDHLYFKERAADDYILRLNIAQDDFFQVGLMVPRRDSASIQGPLPKPFGFRDPVTRQINERFVAKKFEKKEMVDPKIGTPKDVSELTVEDKATNTEFVLVKGVEKNLADYYAVLEFWLKEIVTIKVKKGDKFRIPGVAATYRLVDVDESQAVIVEIKSDNTEGEKLVIKPRGL